MLTGKLYDFEQQQILIDELQLNSGNSIQPLYLVAMNKCSFPKQFNLLQSVMSAQPQKTLSFTPNLLNYSSFLTPFPRAHQPEFHQKIPHSVNNQGTSQYPSCINHKRRRTTHVVNLQEGEVVYFCQRCMQMAQIQGFKGLKIEEFRGSSHCQTFKKHCYEKEKKLNQNSLKIFLENLKECYQRTGNLLDNLGHFDKQIVDSNYICCLFQRFQLKLHKLKEQILEKLTIQQSHARKEWLNIRSNTQWLNQDLEYMISNVCKNHQQITIHSKTKFDITIQQMKKDLSQKYDSFSTLEQRYQNWRAFNIEENKKMREQCFRSLQGLWESIWLGQSISNINFSGLLQANPSPNVCKIIQELSTSHTLH